MAIRVTRLRVDMRKISFLLTSFFLNPYFDFVLDPLFDFWVVDSDLNVEELFVLAVEVELNLEMTLDLGRINVEKVSERLTVELYGDGATWSVAWRRVLMPSSGSKFTVTLHCSAVSRTELIIF